jgi:hypothetical protein
MADARQAGTPTRMPSTSSPPVSWSPKLRAESVFAVTSPDKRCRGLRDLRPYLEEMVTAKEEGMPIVSLLDGHSHGLSFLGFDVPSARGAPWGGWRPSLADCVSAAFED